LEDRFMALLERMGLPLPATNVPLPRNSRWIEADCVWRRPRPIVELDGHATHGTRATYERDRARDCALIAAGWRVMRITWRQLRDEPAELARDLRASLALRPAANLRRA
jgi:very-short-patch-repair endonuclease